MLVTLSVCASRFDLLKLNMPEGRVLYGRCLRNRQSTYRCMDTHRRNEQERHGSGRVLPYYLPRTHRYAERKPAFNKQFLAVRSVRCGIIDVARCRRSFYFASGATEIGGQRLHYTRSQVGDVCHVIQSLRRRGSVPGRIAVHVLSKSSGNAETHPKRFHG
jgi:hypothetical protein